MADEKTIVLPQNALIGSWKPTDLLGRGGQGAVWAAKPVKMKRTPPRALKACFAADEQGRARFRREVETLRRCDAPNILKIYDHDLEWKEHVPGLPPLAFYVAEKCQGSMTQRKAHLGDPRQRLKLFRQACTAVAYLHGMTDPVIHRDIKPENFLIAQELSNVVLADFGIARAHSDTTLTQAFEVVGTPYYRAPEVLHGQPGTIESDIYGLGRLLEWLLTGDVSTDMATRPVPRGADLDDDACNQLDGVIAKATQVTAAHRYKSVQALVEQLPELWISVRPRPKAQPVLPSVTATAVLPVAFEIIRAGDQLGWRQLQSQLRRDFVERILIWRTEREQKWPGDRNKEGGVDFTDSVVEVVEARLALGLAGVYSNNPVFADQRQVIEELLSIPGWNKGGKTAIVETPRALVYLFQYLHGALCMTYEQTDLALQLGTMPILNTDTSTTRPLWKDHGMTGWPKLLGQQCDWAWEYVCNLRARRPGLGQLFAVQRDYEVALAAYSMLMVLHEVADDAANANAEALMNPENFRLDFPPLFMGLESDVIAAATQRTFRKPAVVRLVAQNAKVTMDGIRKLWPARRKAILRWGREVFHRHYYDEDRDNPVPLEVAAAGS